jgi:putative ABC transport system ATP-binding protein
MAPVVRVENLTKIYAAGELHVAALGGVSTQVEAGEFVAIMGPSGSGKSTFMNIIGLLDRPTSGAYFFEGHDVRALSSDQLADLRSRKLGFVFQSYNLLARTNALENVELPLLYAGIPESQRRDAATRALRTVGVEALALHLPNQLSGGQQQRIAIARALVNDPRLILADEPTGALDTRTSHDVMRLITRLNLEHAITIVVVTHERDIAAYARRIITFRDGRIESDVPNAPVPTVGSARGSSKNADGAGELS